MPTQDEGGEAHAVYQTWLLQNGPTPANNHNPCDHSADRQTFFAFAELAALRLQADRAIVSLVDSEWQHIIAEATTDIPSADEAATTDKGSLLGVTSLPRKDAFFDPRMLEDRESSHAQRHAEGCDHFVSLDCTKDDRFREHELVNKDRGVRFAAGVPLASPNTGVFGTLVVMGHSPRKSVRESDIEALQNYAISIVRYLELMRTSIDSSKDVGGLHGAGGAVTHQHQPQRMQDTDTWTESSNSREEDACREEKGGEQDRFMSNFSHELRSPIHGVLGAAQFLQDTISDDYQSSLLQSIVVSSNTLLDTLNVVLDYAKFQQMSDELKKPRLQMGPEAASPASNQPMFATASCDLALIIEDACDTMVAGHFFDNLPGTTEIEAHEQHRNTDSALQTEDSGTTQDVKVVLQLAPRPSWTVQTSPGALSRIMMNVVGNALKFTHKGIVEITLDAQDHGDGSHTKVRIQVRDTGTGMSADFKNNHLFAPFHQENQFAPGVGLGMSVVKQIVTTLEGDIDVQSELGEGTLVSIDLVFPLTQHSDEGVPEDLRHNLDRIKGKHLVLLDIYEMYHGKKPSQFIIDRENALRSVAENWLQMTVSKTSNINQAEADFYLFSEPPPADDILTHHNHTADLRSSNLEVPLMIVTTDLKEAHMINRNHAVSLEQTGRIVQVVSQPCGPRKLAKVLNLSLDRSLQSKKDRAAQEDSDSNTTAGGLKPSEAQPTVEADQYGNINDGEHLSQANGPPSVMSPPARPKSVSKTSSPGNREHDNGEAPKEYSNDPSTSEDTLPVRDEKDDYQFNKSSDPEPPFARPLIVDRRPSDVGPAERDAPVRQHLHGLLVDDNKINLRLLVTLMKKIKYTYEQAENGQEALDTFKASSGTEKTSEQPIEKFDFICMDIGMPLMNGLESTKAIRAHEREHSLPPTYIIACTAWGDEQTQREAEAAGVDAFLPKPLKFANLKELLAGLLARKS